MIQKYWNTLEFLYVSHNHISRLPENMNMPLLKSLEVNGNVLQFLPKTINTLSNLMLLDVRDNLLTHLPSSIGYLPLLEMLCVSDNHLVNLPAEIVNLHKLQSFYVSRNYLTKLPENIHQLEELKYSDSSNNRIEELPEKVDMMHNLEQLSLMFNCLDKISLNLGEKLYHFQSQVAITTVLSNQRKNNKKFDTEIPSRPQLK